MRRNPPNSPQIFFEFLRAIVNRDAAGSQGFLKFELRLVHKFCCVAQRKSFSLKKRYC